MRYWAHDASSVTQRVRRPARPGPNLKVMVLLAAHDLHEVGAPRDGRDLEAVVLLHAGEQQAGRGRWRRRRRREDGRLLQHLQHSAAAPLKRNVRIYAVQIGGNPADPGGTSSHPSLPSLLPSQKLSRAQFVFVFSKAKDRSPSTLKFVFPPPEENCAFQSRSLPPGPILNPPEGRGFLHLEEAWEIQLNMFQSEHSGLNACDHQDCWKHSLVDPCFKFSLKSRETPFCLCLNTSRKDVFNKIELRQPKKNLPASANH